jgi:hypothetical protein
MRSFIFFMLICSASSTIAQRFYCEAHLQKATYDGFHKVAIGPELSVYTNDEFTNLRLLDSNSTEVPYLLQTDEARRPDAIFREYQIINRKFIGDSITSITLRNPEKNAINNISLVIRNADVTKEATLSGSDDQKSWYVLKEHFLLSNINSSQATSELKIVDFPLSNYEYYVIRINDINSAPVNIQRAGYYEYTAPAKTEYFRIPTGRLSQTNELAKKQSRIRLSFDTLRLVEKLTWSVSEVPYYRRSASLYGELKRVNKKGKTETYSELLGSFELKSGTPNVLTIPAHKVKDLVMVIENEDNPPLRIDSLNAYQQKRYITAWFRKNEIYHFSFGSASMPAPVYDLAFFRDSIPANLSLLEAGPVTFMNDSNPTESKTFFTSKIFIWSAIIFVVVLLALMSVKLVRETNAAGAQK